MRGTAFQPLPPPTAVPARALLPTPAQTSPTPTVAIGMHESAGSDGRPESPLNCG
jgi:hypothetical protein